MNIQQTSQLSRTQQTLLGAPFLIQLGQYFEFKSISNIKPHVFDFDVNLKQLPKYYQQRQSQTEIKAITVAENQSVDHQIKVNVIKSKKPKVQIGSRLLTPGKGQSDHIQSRLLVQKQQEENMKPSQLPINSTPGLKMPLIRGTLLSSTISKNKKLQQQSLFNNQINLNQLQNYMKTQQTEDFNHMLQNSSIKQFVGHQIITSKSQEGQKQSETGKGKSKMQAPLNTNHFKQIQSKLVSKIQSPSKNEQAQVQQSMIKKQSSKKGILSSKLFVQKQDKNRSRSKSQTKIKFVKQSKFSMQPIRPISSLHNKLFNPSNLEAQPRPLSSSPEVKIQPITHSKPQQPKKSSIKSINIKKQIRVPVQDYPPSLDDRQNTFKQEQFRPEDVNQFVAGSNFLKSNMNAYSKKTPIYPPSQPVPSPTTVNKDFMSFYEIKLPNKPKQEKPKQPQIKPIEPKIFKNKQQLGSNKKQLNDRQIPHITLVPQKQKSEKPISKPLTPRKKIFAQKKPNIQQQFSQDEMRMILGARGNKYKQAIVMQYIRSNRSKTQHQHHAQKQ